MACLVSVVLCTYNPRPDYLARVLDGLRAQTLPQDQWELILVNNRSDNGFEAGLDLSWHPAARLIDEPRPGLTLARMSGVRAASGEIIVFADDDNVLDADYLAQSLSVMAEHPETGVAGGKSLPVFETAPPLWFSELNITLGCRDLGDHPIRSRQQGKLLKSYPPYAPIGAGMVIRKSAFLAYAAEAENDPVRRALGRKGKSLSSGEDNDIVLTLMRQGWEIAYEPRLSLKHLIPPHRLQPAYLAEINRASSRTWVAVLAVHGINKWPPIPAWTLPLRKARSWYRTRAWRSPLAYIRWKGACGLFEGRAAIRP